MRIRVGRVLRSRPAIALVSGITAVTLVGGIAYAVSNPPAGGVINACAKPGGSVFDTSVTTVFEFTVIKFPVPKYPSLPAVFQL